MKENVIIENGYQVVISDECAQAMEEDGLIYACNDEHDDDAHYFHITTKMVRLAR